MSVITKTKVSNKDRKNIKEAVLSEMDKALETAFFYGFTPIKNPSLKKEDLAKAKDFEKEVCYLNTEEDLKKCHKMENKICLLRNYTTSSFKNRILPGMFCYRIPPEKSNRKSFVNLSILGSLSSTAEIVAIRTSLAILSEQGLKNLKIEINSIGDKESFSKFERDFFQHIKKNLDSLPSTFKQSVANINNLKEILKYQNEDSLADFWSEAPKPINYLTPLSIKHFQEVLEYLECFEVPYSINHFLVPNKQHCYQTIFRIKNDDTEFALGVQHCNLAKKAGLKREISLMTVAMRDNLRSKKSSLKKIKPKFYLVQFGSKAKIKSLSAIEILRKAGIPVSHSLTKNKLTGQLSAADSLNPSHILIIGEKEALEDSIIVRNTETRVQEVVPFSRLVSYLRSIRA